MEHSNLENDPESRAEIIFDFVEEVAPLVLCRQITDDAKSPTNGLSGLDQVIMFAVGEYLDEEFNLNFVKAGIILELGYLKKEELDIDDDFYDDEVLTSYEDMDYVTKGLIENYFYRIDEPEFKRKLLSIAKGHIQGLYTADNPSPKNGKTGLQQVILYASQLLYSENSVEDGRLLDLKGGSDLRDNFKNCDDAFYNE
jgi:hypothetical protein